MPDSSIGGMILRRIAESPSAAAMRTKRGDTWTDISYAELGERMEAIASGLLTAIDDLADHAAIAILGNTSEDWIACDFAALSVGLRTVPVYATLLPEEVGYMHADTDSVISIVEDAAQLAKVREMRKGFTFFDHPYGPEAVKLQHIVVMNPEGVEPADDWESLADLEARGREKLQETAAERAKRSGARDRNETCTYTYTSGTTGPPKAVIQTNENMLSMIENIGTTGLFRDEVREGGLFLFLPLAHSFGRLIEFGGPFFDSPIVISSVPTLVDDLVATKPGFFPAAPRVFEKMKAKIEGKVAGAPPLRQKLFHSALNAGKATIPYRCTGQPLPLFTKLKFRIADKVVLSKLRDALGFTRSFVLLSGSAPLNSEVHEFFMAMGLDLLEAYGLTETCPGLTANLPGRIRIGTVGPALPGVTIKIADDGEILAKGPNITPGYLNREDATKDAFDDEGWFCTGDLGSVDSDGFVKITGRKKELMKTSGGKYIAPAKLEGRLKNLPIIQEAVTIADHRNYVTALIAVDTEEIPDWAAQNGVEPDPFGDAVKQAVQAHVDEVNSTLASYESIKYFHLVEPMTTDSGLLTASLKVKRKVVHERYADEIEAMYNKKKPS
ncbi:MAG: long-chain fatty acid--CoA ligase [Deltaproteobacteria bacterium]|nr:MAG: long-chain fatty acid--CoA ligase [Deltaproteobacteria bacterium]